MSDENVLLVEDRGAVRILTLHRPEKKNAMSPELALALAGALASADADEDVRVVVVCGAGDSFCAGADVHLFLALGEGDIETGRPVAELFRHVRDFEKPIVAAVHGQAVGMGVTLLPHFDLVYAADDATFLTPFVRLGLVLELGSSFNLPRLIGRQRTNELVLGARPIDAATAESWGLVNRVFARDEFLDAVMESAQNLAALPPGAVVAAKKLIREGEALAHDQAVENEDSVLSKLYGSPENVAVVRAFLESRKKRKAY